MISNEKQINAISISNDLSFIGLKYKYISFFLFWRFFINYHFTQLNLSIYLFLAKKLFNLCVHPCF